MKKRFLSFLLTLSMLLTMVVLPAYAEGETTALTLNNYNIVTNAIRLEFSNTITEASVSVTSDDGTALTAKTPKVTDNIVNVTLSDKMDIEKKYILDFSVTDENSQTLTAKKLIEFTVHWNDDFESYDTKEDLDVNYYKISGNEFTKSKFSDLTDCDLVTDEAGNNSMKIYNTGTSGVWIKKTGWSTFNQTHKYYTLEADYEIINVNSSDYWMKYCTSYYIDSTDNSGINYNMRFTTTGLAFNNATWDSTFTNQSIDTYTSVTGVKTDVKDDKATKETIAVSTYKNGTNDSLDIFWDGKNIVHNKGTLRATGGGVFGILKSYSASSGFRIDNWKIYEVSLTDYVALSMKHCNVTTKAIQLVYTEAINTENMPAVSLKNGDISINTTQIFDKASNTLVITPESPLDLSKAYILNVTGVRDENGMVISALDYSKTFEFETMFYDDFDSYDETADLDKKYQFVYGDVGKKTTDAADFSVATDVVTGSNALKMVKTTSNLAIAPKFSGYFTLDHTNNYYTLEFDARPTDGCWKFDIPMYQAGTFDGAYIQFRSGDNNIKINGLFGFENGWVLDKQTPVFPESNSATIALTIDYYNGNTDFEGLFYDGIPAMMSTDYSYSTAVPYSRHFAFKSRNELYIDNLKAYKVNDIVIPEGDVVLSDTVIDSEKITLTYNSDVEANVSLTADGEAYAVNTTFENSKIVIKPANSAKFDMNKQYNLKVTNVANRFGKLAADYDKTFRFKLIWEDDFSSYNEQADLDSKYFVVGGYKKPSEVKNTENDYLYKLDSENDRLILNGTDGITSTNDQTNKQFIMPIFNFNSLSLEYWKDYSFEYTLSKDKGTYYRVESYYSPWTDATSNLVPSANYNHIFYGIWYQKNNSAAQLILDGAKTAVTATADITEDVINMKIIIDEDEKVKVYKNGSKLYENNTSDWKHVPESLQFAFRNSGVAGDKYYLDNLLAYKVIYIDDNDLYLTDVRYTDNKVTADVNVTSDEEISDGKIFIAAYDENAKLVGVSETASLALGEAIPVEIANASNVKYIKAFAWGNENLKALTSADSEVLR